jgi:NitT/TauT family transport system permease protein
MAAPACNNATKKDKLFSAFVCWLPAAVLAASLVMHISLPNRQFVSTAANYSLLLSGILAVYAAWAIVSCLNCGRRQRLRRHAPLAAVAFGLLTLYELVTLKLNLLPLPFFPSPVKIFEAYTNDAPVMAISVLYSLRLLICGYAIGVLLGLPTGIMMGWYKQFHYWVNPLVRIVGPYQPPPGYRLSWRFFRPASAAVFF